MFQPDSAMEQGARTAQVAMLILTLNGGRTKGFFMLIIVFWIFYALPFSLRVAVRARTASHFPRFPKPWKEFDSFPISAHPCIIPVLTGLGFTLPFIQVKDLRSEHARCSPTRTSHLSISCHVSNLMKRNGTMFFTDFLRFAVAFARNLFFSHIWSWRGPTY